MRTAVENESQTQKLLVLSAYPAAIEQAELAYIHLGSLERSARLEVEDFEGDFEITISGDKNCKNDQDRKAKRAALQKGKAYRQSLAALSQVLEDKAVAYAGLNRLRNEFRIVLAERNLTIPGVHEN